MQYWWWKAGPDSGDFFPYVFMILTAYLLALVLLDLYETRTDYRIHRASTLTAVVGAVLGAGLGLSGLFYLLPHVKLPRGVLLIQMALAIPIIFLWRINFWRLREDSLVPKRMLIVGAGKAGQAALEILNRFGSEYKVVGFVDDDPGRQTHLVLCPDGLALSTIDGCEILGSSRDLLSMTRRYRVDGIVVAVVGPKRQGLIEATLQCRMEGVFVSDLLTLGEELAGRILLQHTRDSWFVFAPGFLILHHKAFKRLKRMTDVVCAMIGLILASPILLAAAALIKLDSRGPVFFRQTRVGQNERPFTALKLRTMAHAAYGASSPYTEKTDPRVTRVGRVLRFFRIDEIPQMWNVLKGEMSFIGPRAEWDLLVKEYKEKIPYYSMRHVVKPGITGWAQVNYRYGSSLEDTFRKLELDLYYVKNMSVALDIKILIKTVSVVLLGKGSR
jgi:sugar transferase (PEP-CTERM system associated)